MGSKKNKFYDGLLSVLLMALVLSINGQTPLQVNYSITQPCDTAPAGGGVSLNISGGVMPYAVTWCNNGTTSQTNYTGLISGIYNVIVQDSLQDIIMLKITVSPQFAWDSLNPNLSRNRLGSNQNGWVEFGIDDTTLQRDFGFVYDNPGDTSFVTAGFAFRNDSVKIIFQGEEQAIITQYNHLTSGNKYRIERENSYFKYYVNGKKVFEQLDELDESKAAPGLRFKQHRADRDGERDDDPVVILVINVSFSNWLDDFRYAHKSDCNKDFNWIYTEIYDGEELAVNASMQFYDLLGRPIQAQSMNTDAGKILCSETKYDFFGRKALTTLPAPVLTTTFCYVPHFVTTDVTIFSGSVQLDYTAHFFDKAGVFYPLSRPVSGTTNGQLGWYYSNNNTFENRVASSGFPYSLIEYYDDPTGAVKRASSPGEVMRIDAGHELKSFVMPENGELYYVYGAQNTYNVYKDAHAASFGPGYVPPAEPIYDQIHAQQKIFKYISVDQHGEESITFKDIDGKVLATCLSGKEDNANVHEQSLRALIQPGEYADIHIPSGCETLWQFSFPFAYISDVKIEDIDKNFEEVDIYDFVMNRRPGYYRIHNKENSIGFMYFDYRLNYHNFALYYYDNAGNLTGTVSPEGVDYANTPEVELDNFANEASFKINAGAVVDATYAPTSNSKFKVGRGAVFFTAQDILNNSGKGCYYCSDAEEGLLTKFSNNLFKTGFTPGFNDNLLGENSTGCTGIKYIYTYTLNVRAEGGLPPESLTGDFKMKAIFEDYTRPNGSGGLATIQRWVLDKDNPVVEFDVSQAQSIWCNKLKCTILGVAKQKINVLNGVESLVSENSNYSFTGSTDDPDCSNSPYPCLQLAIRGIGVEFSAKEPQHKSISSNQYNSVGELQWKYTPDGQRTDYLYRKDGQIRFSQNAEQRSYNRFSYTNYDDLGRPVEIGEYDGFYTSQNPCLNVQTGDAVYFFPHLIEDYGNCDLLSHIDDMNFAHNIVDNADELVDSKCKDVIRYTYDIPDNTLGSANSILANRKQRFITGNLNKTSRYKRGSDSNPYCITWFSKNELGRAEWEVHYNEGVGYKTFDYLYDFNGNVVKTILQKDKLTEKFAHNYIYNRAKQLTEVQTVDERNVTTIEAQYRYYLHGPLKRQNIYCLTTGRVAQGVDYTYTLQGQLKAINNAHLDATDPGNDGYQGAYSIAQKDLFGMELDYYANDYLRSGTNFNDGMAGQADFAEQFNGNIKSVRWKTKDVTVITWEPSDPPNTHISGEQNMYGFKYDSKRGWMTEALMGNYTPPGLTFASFRAGDKYSERNISYSLNGNIKELTRTGESHWDEDHLGYSYYNATNYMLDTSRSYNYGSLNQLQQIDGDIGLPNSNLQQDPLNYKYNRIGQMTYNLKDDQAIDYDAYGKVVTVWNHGKTRKKVSYVYDASGVRTQKISYFNSNTNLIDKRTYYITDASGKVHRIIEADGTPNASQPPSQSVETPIYGLNRLGVRYTQNVFDAANTPTIPIVGPGGSVGYIYNYNLAAFKQTDHISLYELTDHLGNIRVTFLPVSLFGAVANLVRSYTDYYPMGMPQPGRQLVAANNYRYGYQGQFAEECDETGWNSFELREYDSRIGRWMCNDPYNQHRSPYMSMGNNWVSNIDPDGGNDEDGTKAYDPDFVGPLPEEAYRVAFSASLSQDAIITPPKNINIPWWVSSTLTTAGELKHSSKGLFGMGIWMGKNLKFYSQFAAPGKLKPFTGNGATGGITRAARIATPLKKIGTWLGYANYYFLFRDRSLYSRSQLTAEVGVNTITTFTALYGVAVGIGWESGRKISQDPFYRENFRPLLQDLMGVERDEFPKAQECILCPK